MCLVTKQKEALIAEKDITIYKKVCMDVFDEHVFHSYYYPMKWKIGVMNSSGLTIDENPISNVFYDEIASKFYNANFENCINDCDFLNIYDELTIISQGLHAFVDNKRFNRNNMIKTQCYVKGFIPKGSKYFEDETGLIVSNQMVITEKINKGNIFNTEL